MNMTRILRSAAGPGCAAALLVAVTATALHSQDWPRFRGPNGSGVSEATTVPASWKDDDYRWVVDLPGDGASSPVLWGPRLFVTAAAGSGRSLLCLDARSGKTLWTRSVGGAKGKKHKNNTHASSTPCADSSSVYSLWQSRRQSELIAHDHDGEKLWSADLGPYRHGQGAAVSPIVVGDLVIVSNDHGKGSFLGAYSRKDGSRRWKIDRLGERPCYSTPCVFEPEGRNPEVIFTHCYEGIIGVDLATGKRNWHVDVFGRFPQRAIGSPVIHGELVIASSGFTSAERNVVAIRPKASIEKDSAVKAEEAWRISRSAPHVPTPLVYRDRVYLISDRGVLTCARAATGEKVWAKRIGGTFFSSPVCVGGKVYCIDRSGRVTAHKTGDEYEFLGESTLREGTRATPAVSSGTMFIRSDARLYAIGGAGGDSDDR